MTREEEIKQAAYSQYCDSGSICFTLMCDSFKQGATWADANPKQDLADLSRRWHSTYEIPSGEKPIIYETKNYKFGVLNNVDPSRWNWYVNGKYSIIIWAYADDLIPKGGEQ